MDQNPVEPEEPSEDTACPDLAVPNLAAEQPWTIPREYESGGRRWFSDAVRELESAHQPLLAQISRVEMADMPRSLGEGEPLPTEASPLYRATLAKHEWTVHVEDVFNFNADRLLADIDDMARNVGAQKVKMFVEHISEVTEHVGNVVKSNGRDFFDVYAESLEKIEITFDENGDHHVTMFVNPETHDQLKGKAPTPEQQARITAVIDRKRKEWRATRRRRELP